MSEMNRALVIRIAEGILIFSAIIFVLNLKIPISDDQEKSGVTPAESREESPTSSQVSTSVPLPSEEDTIRTFFNLIDEGRATDAVGMMTVADDSQKQTWAVQFNAINHVVLDSIDPSMQEEWTANKHTYKVSVTVSMKSEAANAAIPNYGWENGDNVRWIPIEKVGNNWKIAGIATGP